MAKVHLRDVRKSYADLEVIHGVDIEVADGEFIVIVGPSGCGKSTLLRMVAGLEEITGGEIVIGDRVVNGLEPKDRDIAMVFQNYALYPHMSVFDNMAYGLKLRGLSRSDIDARVKRAGEILDAVIQHVEACPWERSEDLDIRPVFEKLGIKPRKAMHVIYTAVEGRAAGLPLFDSMYLLGRERTLRRLHAACDRLESGA